MKTGRKVLIIVVVIVVIVVAGYFILRDDKDKPKPDTGTDPNAATNTGGRRAVTTVLNDNSGGRWIPKGTPNSAGHCPMGQATIWDGTKWVCCVSDK